MSEPIESKQEGLQSRHVFIDTQAFRQRGHNLTVEPFSALGQRIADQHLNLHLSDITLREIERQIGEMALEAASVFRQTSRQMESWRHKAAGADLPQFKPPSAEDLRQAAWSAFHQRAVVDWRAVVHDAVKASTSLVFDRYFQRKAPFDRDSKEFPDAFVLAALEEWCERSDDKMYVVSADAAVQRAAEASPYLIPIKRLEEVLALVTEAQSPEAAELAERFLRSAHVRSVLSGAIEAQIDRLGLNYSGDRYPEGHALAARLLREPTISKYTVLSRQGGKLKLLIEYDATLDIDLVYEDRSDAFYDRDDDTWFGAQTAETHIVNDVKVKLLVDADTESGDGSIDLVSETVTVAEGFEPPT